MIQSRPHPYYISPMAPEPLARLIEYLAGETGSDEIAGRMAHHIAVCAECRRTLKHGKGN